MLWLILYIAAVVVGGGVVGCLLLLGEEKGDTAIDAAFRCVFVYPWQILRAAIWRVCGDWGITLLDRAVHYTFKTNNCLVQLFYILVLCGGYALFCYAGHPHIPNPRLASYHKVTGFLSIGLCMASFILCSLSDPGVITRENASALVTLYPYDGVFFNSSTCRTCNIPKPARSKHCRLCNSCVARFDHHCVWIGNCVGALNHGLFIAFLVVHAVLCAYGGVALPLTLQGIIEEKGLWKAQFLDPRTGRRFPPTYRIIFQYMLSQHLILSALAVTCIMFAVVLTAFSVWHMYMSFFLNLTTNENFKVPSERKEDVSESEAFKSLSALFQRGFWENSCEVMCPRRWLDRRWNEMAAARLHQCSQNASTKSEPDNNSSVLLSAASSKRMMNRRGRLQLAKEAKEE